MSVPAASIDEVIDELTRIVDWSRARGSRLGYFPALYRKVTISVRSGIADGDFDDGARMERLDVNFVRRKIEVLE